MSIFNTKIKGSNNESSIETEQMDVYVSFSTVDCPSAHFNKEIPASMDLPPSYAQATLQNLVDPRDIIMRLKDMNCKVTSCEGKVFHFNLKKMWR